MGTAYLYSDHHTIVWAYIVQPGKPQMTVWRMRITCWIPKSTNPHLVYVMLIALALQQELHERASMLRYSYIACLFRFSVCFVNLAKGTDRSRTLWRMLLLANHVVRMSLISWGKNWHSGRKNGTGRTRHRFLPSRHRFFLVSLCPEANAEMVPKIPSCHYMLLM